MSTVAWEVHLGAHQRLQALQLHQPLNRLVIDLTATSAQLRRDAPVPIPPLMTVVDLTNATLQSRIFITPLQHLDLVVEGAARQLCHLEQRGQWVLLP